MSRFSKNKGFSLVELLVVISVSAYFMMNLLGGILRNKLNIAEVTRIILSDIRTAQANALASKQYQGTHRCGYGISHVNNDTTGYFIYAGQVNTGSNCDTSTRYNAVSDAKIFLTRIFDSRLEVVDDNDYEDIYFQSPDAKIYIKNQHMPGNRSTNLSRILVRKKGTTCPSPNCIYICIYAFGRIETRGDECPSLDGP